MNTSTGSISTSSIKRNLPSTSSTNVTTSAATGHVRKKPKLPSKNREPSTTDRNTSTTNVNAPTPQATTQHQLAPVKLRGRAPSNKPAHSRSYPRGVGIDFRKLAGLTLLGYIDHHGVNVRNEAPPSELAVAVARHFEGMEIDEEQVIGGFLSRLSNPSNPIHNNYPGDGASLDINNCKELSEFYSPSSDYARKTSYFDGTAPSTSIRRRRRSKNAARPGEQVAAKVTRTDENGSWILASVQRFYTDTETYDVQDEDDTSKLIRLPWNHVMRLSNGDTNFVKGSHVMAIFPETTSFYRAIVSKQPIWKVTTTTSESSNNNPSQTTSQPIVKELILKFEDDEDENGRTPHRRVPARYVIPLPWQYFYEEDDDVDLNPPISTVADA